MCVGLYKVLLIFLDLLILSVSIQLHAHEGNKAVLASGPGSVAGLDFVASVPPGTGPFPVIILLHGSGKEDAAQMIRDMTSAMAGLIAKTHIQVAPNGEQGVWNVYSENSKRDDTGIICTNLTAYLNSFSNVEPIFKILGHSNGAGLTNRILIENDDPSIVAAVTLSSQLTQQQWRNDSFYIGGVDNVYDAPKSSLTKRRVLQLTAGKDPKIPAVGGTVNLFHKPVTFLPWEESAYRFAQAYGYGGAQADLTQDDDSIASVSYLGGQVQACNYKKAEHNDLLDLSVPFLMMQ